MLSSCGFLAQCASAFIDMQSPDTPIVSTYGNLSRVEIEMHQILLAALRHMAGTS